MQPLLSNHAEILLCQHYAWYLLCCTGHVRSKTDSLQFDSHKTDSNCMSVNKLTVFA